MKVFPHTNKSTFVIGERLNRFSSMIIDKIRRVVKAKQQETTEVSERIQSINIMRASWNMRPQNVAMTEFTQCLLG